MCARFIVDRNALFVVMPKKPRRERDSGFLEWYKNKHGLLCYAEETNAEEETRAKERTYAEENEDQMEMLREYKRLGRAHVAAEQQMREARTRLDMSDFKIGSDDRYVLALSLATEATILCTRDRLLKEDFRKLNNIDGKTRHAYPVSPQKLPPEKGEQIKIKEEQKEFLVRNRCEKAAPADPAGA